MAQPTFYDYDNSTKSREPKALTKYFWRFFVEKYKPSNGQGGQVPADKSPLPTQMKDLPLVNFPFYTATWRCHTLSARYKRCLPLRCALYSHHANTRLWRGFTETERAPQTRVLRASSCTASRLAPSEHEDSSRKDIPVRRYIHY